MQIKRKATFNSKATYLLIGLAAFLLASCSASKDYVYVKTYDGKKSKYYTDDANHPWEYVQPNPFVSCKIPSLVTSPVVNTTPVVNNVNNNTPSSLVVKNN
jgi:hypothetical protein